MDSQARFRRVSPRSWGCVTLYLLLQVQLTLAADSRIAVLYPEAKGRVAQLYATIIKGMQADGVSIQSRALSADTQNDDINKWLWEEGSQAVIMLGKQGQRFSQQLNLDIPVITGAHVSIQADRSAVTLAADPEQLLSVLKQLEPGIRRVHVIYSETNSGWLIERARRDARKKGIELNAIRADTIQASGQALRDVLESATAQGDAIWLQLDPVLPIKPLLPEMLKVAWEKNLIIFSGNPYHVQQGILFALYPDYKQLGRQLVELSMHKISKKGQARHEPSRYLKSAINTRTASHLGIQVSNSTINDFNLVFPAR